MGKILRLVSRTLELEILLLSKLKNKSLIKIAVKRNKTAKIKNVKFQKGDVYKTFANINKISKLTKN